MLSISNLCAGYGDQEVLHGVDISVAPDEIVALIGPNGAGKSTVLKAVFSQCDVTEGKIFWKDRDITHLATHELIEEGICFVPQGRILFSDLSVRENLEMGAFVLADRDVAERNLSEVFGKFPMLKQKQNEYAFALSGGQQQMLAIGRALMQNPQLLLLDEPSLGLAPKTMKEIFQKIVEINQEGIGVMIVEQNAKQAVSIASSTYVLEDGKIALKAGKEILSDPRIKSIYFGGR
ncbi:MAG: ABC transporter ATP-binding protein [Candidatus Diapherotrites archaeon]|uniref:ABC transporter ATP-binding protein n=1 Tax=Candidatus Iainarchaeum sp. TaxID=3101447 RepID=A0A8T4LG74_9ARCH|nr:ABC transporter ATP-binding protein [Candidatus Diapherotrites archaeon]